MEYVGEETVHGWIRELVGGQRGKLKKMAQKKCLTWSNEMEGEKVLPKRKKKAIN